jgi:nucleotide-binding universal stress UspA family protein
MRLEFRETRPERKIFIRGANPGIYKSFAFREARRKGIAMAAKTESKGKAPALKIRNILVPVDFSDNSSEAMKYAGTLARQFQASVTLLHVVEPAPFISDLRNVPNTLSDEEVEARAYHELELLIEEQAEASIEMKKVVRRGKAYDEIVKAAKQLKADLIVISTHGYTGLKHTLLGSTAERVVRHTACPVLVLPSAKT